MTNMADTINADIDARIARFETIIASVNALDDATLRRFAESLSVDDDYYADLILGDIERDGTQRFAKVPHHDAIRASDGARRFAKVPHHDAIYGRANAIDRGPEEYLFSRLRGLVGQRIAGRARHVIVATMRPLALTPEAFSPEEIRCLRAMLAPLGIAV